jgi:hypothetical protein
MLDNVGFTWEYFDWLGRNIQDWRGLCDYQQNRRISLRADKKPAGFGGELIR